MSIVMLNWNRKHYSIQTLERMIKNTTIPHEFIFVDNGSIDGTREYLKSMEHKTNADKVTYVFNDKNLGVAGGRNSGLVKAIGDYLVTIDDDILVPTNWDVLMKDACDKIPKLGITGVNVEPAKYPVKVISNTRVCPKNGNLGGACLCLPRRVFKTVGYYNYSDKDGGVLYGHEDSLMYYRLTHLGLMSAYIEPRGKHLDVDLDKAYRVAKNKAHKKGSIQLQSMSRYLSKMRQTGDIYVGFDPNYNPPDKDIFTSELITGGRDGRTKNSA